MLRITRIMLKICKLNSCFWRKAFNVKSPICAISTTTIFGIFHCKNSSQTMANVIRPHSSQLNCIWLVWMLCINVFSHPNKINAKTFLGNQNLFIETPWIHLATQFAQNFFPKKKTKANLSKWFCVYFIAHGKLRDNTTNGNGHSEQVSNFVTFECSPIRRQNKMRSAKECREKMVG